MLSNVNFMKEILTFLRTYIIKSLPFCPAPLLKKDEESYYLVENHNDKDIDKSFGRLCVFHGQMGMFVRALSYMMSHGSDGLRQVSEDAVLNANYIKSSLEIAKS